MIRIDTMKPAPVVETPSGVAAGNPKRGKASPDELLDAARKALDVAEVDRAAECYEQLISKGKHLDEVIEDLESAALSYPGAQRVYEVLGMAHTRKGNVASALEAYRKALATVE